MDKKISELKLEEIQAVVGGVSLVVSSATMQNPATGIFNRPSVSLPAKGF